MVTQKDMNHEKPDIRNCDCMDLMREFPDNHFDLAIVDPPYGVGSVTYMPCRREDAHGGHIDRYEVTLATIDMEKQRPFLKSNSCKIVHSGCAKETVKNFGDFNVAPPPEYFKELFRVSRHQIIWGGNNFLLPPSRCFIVWDKCQSEKFSLAMAELAWTSFNSVPKIFRKQSNGTSKYRRIHPTQKPPELYKWLLKLFAKPGDLILDTHMGSGTSVIAAREFGCHITASEIDHYHYHAALEYIERETQQQELSLRADADPQDEKMTTG